jgi:hypothetical protein
MMTKRKQIDKQILKNWKIKMYDTTYPAISMKTDLSLPTIGMAIKYGKASQTTIEKLTKYFNEMEIPV